MEDRLKSAANVRRAIRLEQRGPTAAGREKDQGVLAECQGGLAAWTKGFLVWDMAAAADDEDFDPFRPPLPPWRKRLSLMAGCGTARPV